jgi:2,3-dihydroxybenzoate-AMP ligase
VVVVPTGEPPTLEELRRHLLGEGLAAFKLPDRLEVRDALPMTGVGKVDKPALAASLDRGI